MEDLETLNNEIEVYKKELLDTFYSRFRVVKRLYEFQGKCLSIKNKKTNYVTYINNFKISKINWLPDRLIIRIYLDSFLEQYIEIGNNEYEINIILESINICE